MVATGDVHFMDPEDAIYRSILMATKGFEDADYQPPLYFRTTEEMLEEFAYLGRETAERVVIDEPNRIAEQIGDVRLFIPHPEGKETFQPFWPEAEHDLRRITLDRAHELYGDPLPEIVQKRIDKELGAIIGYGFSTLYMIAVKTGGQVAFRRLHRRLARLGRLVAGGLPLRHHRGQLPAAALRLPPVQVLGFRGTAAGQDRPRPARARLPQVRRAHGQGRLQHPLRGLSRLQGQQGAGYRPQLLRRLPARGPQLHQGAVRRGNVFRAGTIGTIAEKTAYGYVLKYMEERGLHFSNAEKERLARGITGVKRTTGQHPAGMVVLPKDYEIYQFTAIQHPADDMTSETVTTHFDFGSMHDVLVKLDVLGHDDPTMLRRLQDLTGIPPRKVPLNDPEVFKNILSLFSTPEALGLTAEELGVPTGTLGIPEFGTRFVRGMLVETRPSTMEELIRISGLSHGTDVVGWATRRISSTPACR